MSELGILVELRILIGLGGSVRAWCFSRSCVFKEGDLSVLGGVFTACDGLIHPFERGGYCGYSSCVDGNVCNCLHWDMLLQKWSALLDMRRL